MMTFRVILRNGVSFNVVADDLETTISNLSGNLYSYTFKGVKHNKPCYLNPEDIVAILRVMNDEESDNDGKN